jgi:hypothetical protein
MEVFTIWVITTDLSMVIGFQRPGVPAPGRIHFGFCAMFGGVCAFLTVNVHSDIILLTGNVTSEHAIHTVNVHIILFQRLTRVMSGFPQPSVAFDFDTLLAAYQSGFLLSRQPIFNDTWLRWDNENNRHSITKGRVG